MPVNANTRRWLPSRAWTAERVGLLPGCVLLVLAGLFGMHGLADHGMGTDIATPMAGSMSADGPGGHAVRHNSMADEPNVGLLTSHGRSRTARLPEAPSPVLSPATGPLVLGSRDPSALETARGTSHQGHGDNMGAGLCLAILVGLLLGLAAWMSAGRRRPLSQHLPRLIPAALPRGRDPDPPSLAVLSVWRC